MSRTYRNPQFKFYWGETKERAEARMKEFKGTEYEDYFTRWYLRHGKEAGNLCVNAHKYFNRAHRRGRASARNQLRPHLVTQEDFYFDDSVHEKAVRGVWWEIT
jgi:hypothetical protein